jgi:DNA invertase Pin-like site-specific DNA recombinase
MAAMAEMERDLARERTTAALMIAKRKGRVRGQKTVMTPKRIQAARKLLAWHDGPRNRADNRGIGGDAL